MTEGTPVACSLGADELERRLATVSELGRAALISSRFEGGRHLLRFRASAETRRRLEDVVAAEAACCAFLDLELRDDGPELALSIAAPAEGQTVADELAAAFEPDGSRRSSSGFPRLGGSALGGAILLALCCVAGPLIFGAAAWGAVGPGLELAVGAVAVLAISVALHRRRRRRTCCR